MFKLNIQSTRTIFLSLANSNITKAGLASNKALVAAFNLTSNIDCQNNNYKINYQQLAFYRRNNFTRPFNWVKRRGGGFDENINDENKDFLEQVLLDKYSESPLKEAPWKKGEYDPNSVNKRLGLLGIKLGSIPQWTKDGKKIYTTLIQVLDNHVIDYVPPKVLIERNNIYNKNAKRTKDGNLGMAIVGALSSDPRNYTPQYLEIFKNAGVPPKRKLTKFMISQNAVVQPGTPLYASHFRVGDYVDVGSHTIGFGFQGVMKRWGLKGGPRSHGSTKFHRKRGTIGSGRDRRPIKGMKMPGKMGSKWRQLMGLKIWRINNKYNILYIHGPVIPGPNHSYVRIADSCLPKNRERFTSESHPPFPTYYPDQKEHIAEEIFDEELHKFTDPTITFETFEAKKITKRDGAKIARIKS